MRLLDAGCGMLDIDSRYHNFFIKHRWFIVSVILCTTNIILK
jgi:hypothetical protein